MCVLRSSWHTVEVDWLLDLYFSDSQIFMCLHKHFCFWVCVRTHSCVLSELGIWVFETIYSWVARHFECISLQLGSHSRLGTDNTTKVFFFFLDLISLHVGHVYLACGTMLSRNNSPLIVHWQGLLVRVLKECLHPLVELFSSVQTNYFNKTGVSLSDRFMSNWDV